LAIGSQCMDRSLFCKQDWQNELWIGRTNAYSQLYKDPLLMAPDYAHLPAGHQEGRADGFYNVAEDIYGVIPGDAAHQPSAICSSADA
jgi:hypothetical protein